jgi:uncharacterized protein (UPF0332 family)
MNLKNSLNKLEQQGKLKKQDTKIDYLNSTLHAAYRNFQAAASNLDSFEEVTFKLAYDGLLQISRVVLLLNGYRPDGGQQHKTTFEVAELILGKDFSNLVNRINIYRIKRNNCIYDPKGLITKTEAENILKTAKEYWHKVKKYLKKENPQLELFYF